MLAVTSNLAFLGRVQLLQALQGLRSPAGGAHSRALGPTQVLAPRPRSLSRGQCFTGFVCAPTERSWEAERTLVGRSWQESLVSKGILEETHFPSPVRRMLSECTEATFLGAQALLGSRLPRGANASYSPEDPAIGQRMGEQVD